MVPDWLVYVKLKSVNFTEFEIALTRVVSSKSSYWKDLQEVFDKNFECLTNLPSSSFPLVKLPIPKNHVLIKRILVTPKRIICLPATPVASSRLLRNYGDLHEFVIVSFREEQFQKLEDLEAMKRVQGFIMNGITVIKHYWFFCASASQLRDHKAYFVAANSYSEVGWESATINFQTCNVRKHICLSVQFIHFFNFIQYITNYIYASILMKMIIWN